MSLYSICTRRRPRVSRESATHARFTIARSRVETWCRVTIMSPPMQGCCELGARVSRVPPDQNGRLLRHRMSPRYALNRIPTVASFERARHMRGRSVDIFGRSKTVTVAESHALRANRVMQLRLWGTFDCARA